MIMEAIDALKEPERADRQSISEHIESKYSELPAEHGDLLAANLTTMTENGALLLVNNSYVKPGGSDAAAPVKRGRGRPPKRKEAPSPAPAQAPAGDPEVASRPRGRPRKDPESAKPAAGSASKTGGRPRGRPRKAKPESVQNAVEA